MSLSNILVPNSYTLYCANIVIGGETGPAPPANFSSGSFFLNAAQSIPNALDTLINFNASSGNLPFSNVNGNIIYNGTVPGLITVNCQEIWAVNATGIRQIWFQLADSTKHGWNWNGTTLPLISSSLSFVLQPGQVFTCWCNQNSTGNLNLNGTASSGTFFTECLVTCLQL